MGYLYKVININNTIYNISWLNILFYYLLVLVWCLLLLFCIFNWTCIMYAACHTVMLNKRILLRLLQQPSSFAKHCLPCIHQVLLCHAIASLSWAFYDLGDMNYSTLAPSVYAARCRTRVLVNLHIYSFLLLRVFLFATITQSINVFPACYPFSLITCSVLCFVLYRVL